MKKLKIKTNCIDCKKPTSGKGLRCPSCCRTGELHPCYKGGMPLCIDCNKKLGNYQAIRCRSCDNKNRDWTKIMKDRKGENHPNFKGRIINIQGYILIYSPNHPYKNNHNYVLEHRLVMENYLGRYLNNKEVVHHLNGIKNDNKIENLLLFPNESAHQLFKHFNDKTFICKFCQKDQRTI